MNPFFQNPQQSTQGVMSALELFDFATPTINEGLDLQSLPGFRQRDKALNDLSQTRDSIGGQRQVTNDLLLGDLSMSQPDIFQPEQVDNSQLFSPVRRRERPETPKRNEQGIPSSLPSSGYIPKNAKSFSSSSERSSIARGGGVAILLDSNQADGVPVISPRIVIPDNASKAHRAAAQSYVNEIAKVQKSRFGRTLKPQVLTKSQNKRGRSNATHLEGFSVEDEKFVDYIRTSEGREWYRGVIQSTVGSIPGSKMFLPHSSKDPGAVNKKRGWSEVSLAQEILGK